MIYIGLNGPLILYLKSLSRNSALVQITATTSQSHNELSLGRTNSVSVALNTNEEERGGGRWRVGVEP